MTEKITDYGALLEHSYQVERSFNDGQLSRLELLSRCIFEFTTYHWLKGGDGSMWEHNGLMRPRCWFRVQLRVADLMARVDRVKTIRKGQP